MKLDTEFEVKIQRTSRKKTVSLEIREGFVQIIAPKALSAKEIENIIIKKTKWIRNKLLIQKSKTSYKSKEFVSGESFSYLGKNYPLKIVNSKKPCVEIKEDRIFVYKKMKGRSVRALLENWYKQQGLKLFEKKTKKYQEIIGVKPSSISTRTYSRRWGSCSSKKDITFNWLILMAPHSVIDYVVVHELCHLIHHNHSPKYWRIVKSFYPNYKEKIEWLRYYSRTLVW